VADSSRSPLDDSDFDAEPETTAGIQPSGSKPTAVGKPILPIAGSGAVAPVPSAEEAWFRSEFADDFESTRRPDDSGAAPVSEPPRGRRDLPRLVRWAIPILAVLVVLETGWLVSRFFRTPSVTMPASPASVPGLEPAASGSGVSDRSRAGASTLPGSRDPRAATAELQPPIAAASAAATVPGVTSAPSTLPPPSSEPGRVVIALPFQVQVYEGERFVGLNDGNLPLSAGSHQLQLVNDSLEFRVTERVTISPGRTTRLAPQVPSVPVQLNAVPWAEVTIDGTSVGETPLGNVSVTIGPHMIVFRNPQFAEQTRSVVVTAQSPIRVSVDLRN
jgi:hypothetical protein